MKIKISMTCVLKEYEVEIKMEKQWLQLKVKFYWGITWDLLFRERMNFKVGREIKVWQGDFSWWVGWANFSQWGTPPSLSVGKILKLMVYIKYQMGFVCNTLTSFQGHCLFVYLWLNTSHVHVLPHMPKSVEPCTNCFWFDLCFWLDLLSFSCI